MTSPPLDKFADTLKTLAIKSFRQIIGPLFQCVDLHDDDRSVTDVRPKEMPLHQEVFGAVGDTLIRSQQKSAVVILKDAASDGRLECAWQPDTRNDFNEHGAKGEKGAHGRTES